MGYTTRISYNTIRSIDSATFTGSYQAIGSSLTNPASIVKLVNNSDKLVTISVDGTNDHDILPAGSFTLYDYTTNATLPEAKLFMPQGTQYYAKGSAGTGLVYLVVQYIIIN